LAAGFEPPDKSVLNKDVQDVQDVKEKDGIFHILFILHIPVTHSSSLFPWQPRRVFFSAKGAGFSSLGCEPQEGRSSNPFKR